KISPFVLFNNANSVAGGDVSHPTVFMNDFGYENPLTPVMWDQFDNMLKLMHGGDRWLQDGAEIGYVQAPYGAMPTILALPRGNDRLFNLYAFYQGVTGENLGICTDLVQYPPDHRDDGGDIESLPNPG